MTVLCLLPRAGDRIGPALAAVTGAVLVRRGNAAYADVPVADVTRFTRALAFAGISAEPCDADVGAPPGLAVAQGIDLSPLPSGLVALDLVRIERIHLGPATREVLRRRWAGLLAPGPAARARCRALLRDEVVLFAWARHAWASRAALRSAPARTALRPIVFDRDAVTRCDLAGRTSSQDEALGKWLFA